MSTSLRGIPAQLDLPGLLGPPAAQPAPVPIPLTGYHGRRVDFSALARSCGVSRQTVGRRLLALEQSGFLRLLHPMGEGSVKRAAPVLYLRSLRLLEGLPAEMLYRTRMVEAIAALAESAQPDGAAPAARIGYLSRPHGGMLLPVVEMAGASGPALVGFDFCADILVRRGRWSALSRAQRLGLLRQGFVLYPGRRAFFSSARVAVLPDLCFLDEYAGWMAAALDPSPGGLQTLMRRCNTPRTG